MFQFSNNYWILTVLIWSFIFKAYTVTHHQPSRPSSTGLQSGYIPIPVIHEGGGGQTQVQLNPSVYSQRIPYPEHQQPFHRLQTDEWPGYSAAMQPPREQASPILFPQHRDTASIHLPPHIRSQSPVISQVMGERPQVILLFLCIHLACCCFLFSSDIYKALISLLACCGLDFDRFQ